ncbi:hypothetical protein E4U42_007036 [Claviceps africana]|uniref:Alpha-1,3-mannosyltransferase CMT1 n=1 Tax=Claviceps africana TaxID=83212 RepID=A0A8K0NKY8_9HYPO|nr:hypothetical protein E4U42_007036 [Claviceps africana]
MRQSQASCGQSQPFANAYSAGRILNATVITQYIDAILNTSSTSLPTFTCPAINTTRYHDLTPKRSASTLDYFFALNLRENLSLLPVLLGNIVEAIKYLGPKRCALSIVEGNSPDGTADVLAALRPVLDGLDISYHFTSSEINPGGKDNGAVRIERLAQLRNMALEPLMNASSKKIHPTPDTTVLFINDVAACAEDILELVYQRRHLGADMTCAMDWIYTGGAPLFYDSWISRTIKGDGFIFSPEPNPFEFAWDVFREDPDAKAYFVEKVPFQVFACWNGAVAFTAQPLLSHELRFRPANESAGECHQGEPNTFCKDMWFHGHGKIAVVPSINLEYSVDKGKAIKETQGFTSDAVSKQHLDHRIDWQLEPPAMVKCIPKWDHQVWLPWNESLTVGESVQGAGGAQKEEKKPPKTKRYHPRF